MASAPLVQGPLLGAPVSRFDASTREFVPSPEKEEATLFGFDLAALDIHVEPRKLVEETEAGDKAKLTAEASCCSNIVPSTVCDKAKAPEPASDWKTAAMEACDKSWAAAAKSMHKEVREAAARHYAEEAAEAGKKRATRKKRLSQASVDSLLAKAKLPRPALRVDHEFIDSLKSLTPERREEMRAAKTMLVVSLQALRDWDAELVKMYHNYGYIEIEVEVDEEEDSDDENLCGSLKN